MPCSEGSKRSLENEQDGNLKKGLWTAEEDEKLIRHVERHGEGNWNMVRQETGLLRCGKSCRLRWANHLRPDLKRGAMSPEEELLFLRLHALLGNKWSRIAAHLPGRTDNEIKNYLNTRMKRQERAGHPLYPPEVEHEVALIRAGGPNTILDAGADDHVERQAPSFLFNSADHPLALPPLPLPVLALDSQMPLDRFKQATHEVLLPLSSISDLKIDLTKYSPLAPLLPPMADKELPSIPSAAVADGVVLKRAFLCEHGQQMAGSGMVHFGTMPRLVSHESDGSTRPFGGHSSRFYSGGGNIPSLCTQEEVTRPGGKRGCVFDDDVEKPAKKLLASVGDEEEMPNLLLGVIAEEEIGNNNIFADHTIFSSNSGSIHDLAQQLMTTSAPLIYDDIDEDNLNQ